MRVISQIESEQSSTYKAFDGIDFEGNNFGIEIDDEEFKKHFSSCYNKAAAILKSLCDAVVDEIALDFQKNANSQRSEQKVSPPQANKKVFVVHGHDEKLKTQVEQFLERLGLQPIILHKQPDQGQTIIEKFEKHSDVSFAIVLFTPDDEGRKKPTTPHWTDTFITAEPELTPRARQNVILEFGYFLGKLGRPKVCGLYCEGVELPSDYDGVLYTKVDANGSWQFKLVKELRAAGFDVDANRLT